MQMLAEFFCLLAIPTGALHAQVDLSTNADLVTQAATQAALATDLTDPGTTLSPEERAAAHAAQFDKEFTVELDMVAAHDKGTPLGVVLDMDTDFAPVSVTKIRKVGLVENWNKAHPDKAVLLGDQVVKVNDILWHHNSQTFAERIKGQFTAAKQFKEGSKKVLSLGIQRPRQEENANIRFLSQREDLHRQMYSAEFTAEIPFEGVRIRDPCHRAMGWTLNSTVNWSPVTIQKLEHAGLIANYNKEHPEAKIRAGDEILQVNHIAFHHSAKTFADRINAQFLTGQTKQITVAHGTKNVLTLRIRRPRTVDQTPETQVYTQEILAEIPLKDARPLGWHLTAASNGDPPTIQKIRRVSLLAEFNQANPAAQVRIGDNIVKVNEAAWQGNSKKFAKRIDKEIQATRPRKDRRSGNSSLKLLIQRRVEQPIEKEWSVELPVLDGAILGWQLNVTDDALPVTIAKIRAVGSVAEYNQNHLEDRLMAGDTIIKVNDVLWRQDSSSFEKRLNEEYIKSKNNGIMHVFLRRPRGVGDRDAEDNDKNRPFAAEFLVRLPVVPGETLGWQLDSANDSVPVTITKIRSAGAVHTWNEDNPLFDLQVGDRIAKVNNVVWHDNTRTFMDRMRLQLEAALKKGKGKGSVSMLIQRPWADSDGREPAAGEEDEDAAGGNENEVMGAVE